MKYDESVCKFNMDTGCVELLLRDGRKISIDCTGVEDALNVNMVQRSELDYLIYSKPFAQKARARAAETAAGCGLSALVSGKFFVSGRQCFLKTQPNCKKVTIFSSKKAVSH